MKWGMTSFEELKEMKERMDLVWNDLFEENPPKAEGDFQPFEKLPKFEGTGRGGSRSRSTRHNP